MKKLLVVFLMFVVAGLFATGLSEEKLDAAGEEPRIKLMLATEGDFAYPDGDGKLYYVDKIIPEFEAANPGVVVIWRSVRAEDTTKKIDAMIFAGLTPNVYTDYGGRGGLYAIPATKNFPGALPLDEYLPKEFIDQFYPSYIEKFSKNGHVYALPTTSWATVGHVNWDLVVEAGMEDILDDDFLSYDDIYDVAAALKAQGKEAYATAVFAAQTGGDYWIYTFWLSGHGAILYNPDGSIGLNTPEGHEALTLMKRWYDEGFIPFGAVGFRAGDYINLWMEGNVVSRSFSWGTNEPTEADPDPWKDLHMVTPRKPGVELAPVASGMDVAVAFNVDDEATKQAAANLVAFLAGREMQEFRVREGRYPSMDGVGLADDAYPNFKIAVENMAANGVLNMGIGTPHYAIMREQWMALIGAIINEELTVQEALDRFETDGNELIVKMAR